MRSALVDDRIEGAAPGFAGARASIGSVTVTGLGTLVDRIVYGVFDVVHTDGGYPVCCVLGSSAAVGRLALQGGAASSPQMTFRGDFVAGSQNVGIQVPGRAIGRHIGWMQTALSMTLVQGNLDAASARTVAVPVAGAGMSDSAALVVASNGGHVGVYAAAFRGSHTAAERARVIRWLARRYNVPLSGGGLSLRSRLRRRMLGLAA